LLSGVAIKLDRVGSKKGNLMKCREGDTSNTGEPVNWQRGLVLGHSFGFDIICEESLLGL
jgi:hypothetical protein